MHKDFDLNEFVQKANAAAKTPVLINDDMRFEGLNAEGKTLVFKYTFVNITDSALSADFNQDLKNNTVRDTCQLKKKSMDMFIENKIMLRTDYYNNANKLLLSVEVAPKQCRF